MGEKRLGVLSSGIVMTEEMDAYNSLRDKFLKLSKEAEAKTSESYDKNVKSYTDLQISAQYMLDHMEYMMLMRKCLEKNMLKILISIIKVQY